MLKEACQTKYLTEILNLHKTESETLIPHIPILFKRMYDISKIHKEWPLGILGRKVYFNLGYKAIKFFFFF